MARREVAKGKRREREAARLLGGTRVPLSGSAGGDFAGDVVLPNGWRCEVKARRDGFKSLYAWLEGADVLLLKADRKPWLAVLPAERLRELLSPPEGTPTGTLSGIPFGGLQRDTRPQLGPAGGTLVDDQIVGFAAD